MGVLARVDEPDAWVGRAQYRLDWKEDQTFVVFRQANWEAPVGSMYHRSTKSARYPLSPRGRVLPLFAGECLATSIRL